MLSLVFLLGGTAIVLLAFGKFAHLGWHSPQWRPAQPSRRRRRQSSRRRKRSGLRSSSWPSPPCSSSLQALIGGGVAHYRAEPGDFFGVDLSAFLPSNLLRTWHLQLAILWIATSYVGGALFVAGMLGRSEPAGQRLAIHLLFGAIVFVAVGSLLGEWAGILQLLGKAWFWFGNQGWEYLEIGRAWQILLAIGLVFWFGLLWRNVAPARRDPERRGLIVLLPDRRRGNSGFLPAGASSTTAPPISRSSTPGGSGSSISGSKASSSCSSPSSSPSFSMNSAWCERNTALRVIYLDVILIFGGGLIGTGHHWYFNGQTELNMALSSAFSALEVVPLTLITLDAWDFVTVTTGESTAPFRHKWTFYFLMAVGFWNFIGAGIFGFLINMPIVSYFEMGTNLTPNHGHAAMMGVFGMLAVALMVFVLRETTSRRGLASPGAIRPLRLLGAQYRSRDDGASSACFPPGSCKCTTSSRTAIGTRAASPIRRARVPRLLEWLRMPGDLVFIFLGALPIAIAVCLGYLGLWARRGVTSVSRPVSAE